MGGRVGPTFFHPKNLAIDQKNGFSLIPIFIFQSHLPLGSTTTMSQNVNNANSQAAADKKAAMQANSEWFFAKADKKGAWMKGGLSEPDTEESDTDVVVATPLAREPRGYGMYQDVLPAPKLERRVAYHPPVIASDFESDGDDDGMLGRNNTPIPKPVKRLPAKGLKNRMDDDDDLDDLMLDAEIEKAFESKRMSKAAMKRMSTIVLTDTDEEKKHRELVKVKLVKKEEGRGSLAQRWCFTYNNPGCDGDEFAQFLESKADVKLAVFQMEEGENGTQHLQGYVETNKRMYSSGFHAMMAPHRMAVFHAKGTKLANHKYCTKHASRLEGPWYVKSTAEDYGRKNGNQGKRTDIDEYMDAVNEAGGLTVELMESHPGMVMRYGKQTMAYLAAKRHMLAEKEDMDYWKEQYRREQAGEEFQGQQQRELILYFGPTAVGKTSEVKKIVKGKYERKLYEKAPGTNWWGNWKGEDDVLIDEYKGGQDIDEFKRITNVGMVEIEGKGTEIALTCKRIFITSNRHPSQWWKRNNDEFHTWGSPDYQAAIRRFAEVYWWNDAKELTILKNPGPQKEGMEWKRAWAKWQKFWEWRSTAALRNVVVPDDKYFTL